MWPEHANDLLIKSSRESDSITWLAS